MSGGPVFAALAEQSAAWFSGGVGLGAGVYLFKWLFDWIGGRIDRRETALEAGNRRIDDATQKLIEHLQHRLEIMNERIEGLERELDECRKRDAARETELAKLKAVIATFGEARQQAQLIIAREKKGSQE